MQFKQNDTLKQLNHILMQIEGLYHEIALLAGLSDSAYNILYTVLELGEGCTQTDVYRNNYMNKQTVNSSVKKLCKDGLIRLESGTGRETKLYFTKDGKSTVSDRIIPIEALENDVIEEMSADEQAEFLRLITKYLHAYQRKVQHLCIKLNKAAECQTEE